MKSETASQLAVALAAEEDKLLACIHCGLCLEACPTYVHTNDENDSPRGRIYLMRAVEEERLSCESPAFARHINRCLGCRACEQACPAGVEYGQLLEAARADLAQTKLPRSFQDRLLRIILRRVWTHPLRLRMAFTLARLVRDTGLARLLLFTKLPHLVSSRLEFALALLDSSRARALRHGDDTPHAHQNSRAVVNQANKDASSTERAMLFTGCVMEGLFARVNRATRRVLGINGCVTNAPREQVCCGALHAHAGDMEGARMLARQNIEAFADNDNLPIITNAGGCGAMLASYSHLLSSDKEYCERAHAFSSRVRDVSQQLETTGIKRGANIESVVTTYDASCHLIYGQGAGEAPLEMLRAVSGLRFAPLEESNVCCGGAGVYNLLEPLLSKRVLDEKLAHIKATGAEILATGNPGCQMQIGAGARLGGMQPLRIFHPVELLDESYARAGFYAAQEQEIHHRDTEAQRRR